MKTTRLGVITPSSNTVLEPVTSAMLAGLDTVSAHFARFPVTEISRDAASNAQFEIDRQLKAADLLADARVDAIIWSGTAASWLGFDKDEQLCAAIHQRTGIPASSSVLAVNRLFELAGVERFGLVTPYAREVQDMIVANYAELGLVCAEERHLGETCNFAFADVTEDTIAAMVGEVAGAEPDAVVIMCTNMNGARIAPALEQQFGIPVFDSTSAGVWAGLQLAGREPQAVAGWGQMFGMSAGR